MKAIFVSMMKKHARTKRTRSLSADAPAEATRAALARDDEEAALLARLETLREEKRTAGVLPVPTHTERAADKVIGTQQLVIRTLAQHSRSAFDADALLGQKCSIVHLLREKVDIEVYRMLKQVRGLLGEGGSLKVHMHSDDISRSRIRLRTGTHACVAFAHFEFILWRRNLVGRSRFGLRSPVMVLRSSDDDEHQTMQGIFYHVVDVELYRVSFTDILMLACSHVIFICGRCHVAGHVAVTWLPRGILESLERRCLPIRNCHVS